MIPTTVRELVQKMYSQAVNTGWFSLYVGGRPYVFTNHDDAFGVQIEYADDTIGWAMTESDALDIVWMHYLTESYYMESEHTIARMTHSRALDACFMGAVFAGQYKTFFEGHLIETYNTGDVDGIRIHFKVDKRDMGYVDGMATLQKMVYNYCDANTQEKRGLLVNTLGRDGRVCFTILVDTERGLEPRFRTLTVTDNDGQYILRGDNDTLLEFSGTDAYACYLTLSDDGLEQYFQAVNVWGDCVDSRQSRVIATKLKQGL